MACTRTLRRTNILELFHYSQQIAVAALPHHCMNYMGQERNDREGGHCTPRTLSGRGWRAGGSIGHQNA